MHNRGRFPLDVNTAEREWLLRVPGLGVRTVDRLLAARRHRTLRLDDIARLSGSIRKARPFIVTPDHRPRDLDHTALPAMLTPSADQLSLFA